MGIYLHFARPVVPDFPTITTLLFIKYLLCRTPQSSMCVVSAQVCTFRDRLLFTSKEVDLQTADEGTFLHCPTWRFGRQKSGGVGSVLCHQRCHLKLERLAQCVSHVLKQVKLLHLLWTWLSEVTSLMQREVVSVTGGRTSSGHSASMLCNIISWPSKCELLASNEMTFFFFHFQGQWLSLNVSWLEKLDA